jgi:MFS family permease
VPARDEFRRNWPLLVAVVSSGLPISIPLYTTGVFMPVWEAEFGWARSQIALGISCYMLALTLASPVIGKIVDSYGVRVPILLSLSLGIAAVAGLSLINASIWSLYVAYFLLALLSSACIPSALTRPVSENFNQARGLAFGITLSATTLSMLVTPLAAYTLYAAYGWRITYRLLALALLLVLPVVFWGLKEVRGKGVARSNSAASAVEASGATLQSAVRMPAFWLMTFSFFLTVFVSTATIGQIVPILIENGFSPKAAVLMQPAMAVGLGASRILVGTLLDRVGARAVYGAVCSAAAFGFLALVSPFAFLTMPAIFLIGAALGAEFDILAFMVSRYFGLRNYGQIFSWIYAANIIGAMLGPIFLASMHDLIGNYRVALMICSALLVSAALIVARVGPYPDWSKNRR